jgi:hypothetical protein
MADVPSALYYTAVRTVEDTNGRRKRMCMMAPISFKYPTATPAQYYNSCGDCGYSTYWRRLMEGFNFVKISCLIILL